MSAAPLLHDGISFCVKKTHFNDTTLAALQESDNICNGIIPAKTYHSAAELIRETQEEVNSED